MDRPGKAKLYRLVDDRSDWEELGIGYASCQPAGDGSFDIVLDLLSHEEGPPWRQTIEQNTQYVREDMIIQWHSELAGGTGDPSQQQGGRGGGGDGDVRPNGMDSEEEESGYSFALSFENEDGCEGVMTHIERIQTDMRAEGDVFVMPPATIGNLPAIEDVLKSCQSHIKKHTVSNYLSHSQFIDSLLNLLELLEDIEDNETVRVLFNVVKMIVALNETEVMHILLQDHNYKKFFGLMEYNPDEQTNPRHREFIEKEVKYVSVIPVDDSLLKLIHYTFRLGYLRDIHPGVLDDPMISRIAHMISLNHMEIIRELSKQGDALGLILSAIRKPEEATCSRLQAMTLLYECVHACVPACMHVCLRACVCACVCLAERVG
jgi:hypothetical protein